MAQFLRISVALLLVCSIAFAAENEVCEKLIECEAQAKAKWESCSTFNASVDVAPDHHESTCHNFTAQLHEEIHELTEQKSAHYASCLKRLSPNASDYPLKGKKKTKCLSTKKNPHLKSREAKARRALKDRKEKKNNVQKQCFKDVKKLRTKCHQYAKCCPIARVCRDTSEIEKKIAEKKRELHESHKECRRQKQGKKKNGNKKNHKAKTTAVPNLVAQE